MRKYNWEDWPETNHCDHMHYRLGTGKPFEYDQHTHEPKGTGKPLSLYRFFLLLYGMSFKLKQPPDPIKELHDKNEMMWNRIKTDKTRKDS